MTPYLFLLQDNVVPRGRLLVDLCYRFPMHDTLDVAFANHQECMLIEGSNGVGNVGSRYDAADVPWGHDRWAKSDTATLR